MIRLTNTAKKTTALYLFYKLYLHWKYILKHIKTNLCGANSHKKYFHGFYMNMFYTMDELRERYWKIHEYRETANYSIREKFFAQKKL